MSYRKYGKIRQFSDTVRDVRYFASRDEKPLPVITFIGTVKVHGTNASLMFDGVNLYKGKRNSLLTDKGHSSYKHYGFSAWVDENEDALKSFMKRVFDENCEEGERLYIYGEWAGQGVQSGVAIANIEKSFFMFDACVESGEETIWLARQRVLPVGVMPPTKDFHNIDNFGSLVIDIDFNNPGAVQNELVEITNDIEKNCPVAHRFGFEGTGEGMVWTGYYGGEKIIFKVKGEKHSTSKVKKLASVDPEKLKSINDFVDYAATENRIQQGIKEVSFNSMQQMGDLLRWVANDIIAEEQASMEASSITWKNVAKEVANRVRLVAHNHLNKF